MIFTYFNNDNEPIYNIIWNILESFFILFIMSFVPDGSRSR